jgi:hypothetical protein
MTGYRMRALASALFPAPVVKSGALSFHKPGSEIKPTRSKKSQIRPFFAASAAVALIFAQACRHAIVYCIARMHGLSQTYVRN